MKTLLLPLACVVTAFSLEAATSAAPTTPAKLDITQWPDPLVLSNGQRVKSRKQWTEQRRVELKSAFEHYMYGAFPPKPAQVDFTVERAEKAYFGGKATKKEIWISFGPAIPTRIHLLLIVPNQRKRPAPVFLGMNFCGNHAVVNDPGLSLSTAWFYNNCAGCTNNRATEASRGSEVNTWAIEQSIDRGYAVATFYSGDIVPDQAGFLASARGPLGSADAGAITLWAWGFQRCVDYLVTDRDLDPKRIAVVGHSRNGKTALLAAAFDERIALSIPHQAGCGGTAPSRGKIGEQVRQINDRFPHWFNGEFKKYNDQPEKLPFDQHCLVALMAPRPVLLSNAEGDQWANPSGQFVVLQAAEPVYRLLRAGKLDARQMPELGRLVDSKLGYFIRPGKHSMTREDWGIFLDFADRHFGKKR